MIAEDFDAEEQRLEQAEAAAALAAEVAEQGLEPEEEPGKGANDYADREIRSWDDLDIDVRLLRGIFGYGYEQPSPIQQKSIRPLMDGRDVIAQAQSGTGKTATFTIGTLSRIDLTLNATQALVLSPTKELTEQTAKVFRDIGSMLDGLRVQAVYGGQPMEDVAPRGFGFANSGASASTQPQPHVICGCAGRIIDMLKRNRINRKDIKLVVLDEADDLLTHKFKDQIYTIFQYLSPEVQVGLFSATIPEELHAIIDKIMRNPVRITVKREMLTLEGIKQYFIAMEDDRQKYATLKHLFSHLTVSQCIIYSNSKRRVEDLYQAMCDDGFPVSRIHAAMDRAERLQSFDEFRSGASRVLISSNVTARGIDIQQVSIVINFDLPNCVHTYLHRIGRSGRWGRKGVGINFITRRDIYKMKEIEAHYNTQIAEMPADLQFLNAV